MNIAELFEFILTQGCGVNLASFKKSRAFKLLQSKQDSLFRKYPENTDEGVMLRAGHLLGSTLLNCYSEKEALTKAGDTTSKYGHGIDMRAIITATGNEILKAAKKNLPKEAIVIAKKWKTANADEQIALTKELYHLFTTKDQKEKVEINYDNVYERINQHYDMSERLSGFKSVMPLGYGKWNKKDNMANCQGKTQLLVAFAEMVGAKVLLMLPNATARDVLDDLKLQASFKVGEDIEERKIKFPDKSFMQSLHAGILQGDAYKYSKSMHLCPVIQIRDGRWIVIDSNALNWGILSNRWDLDNTYLQLEKYSEVLPGLSLCGADHAQRDEAVKKIWDKLNDFLARSKKLQTLLDPIDDLTELVQAFGESDELDFLLKESADEAFPDGTSMGARVNIGMQLLLGPTDEIFESVLSDPKDFLQKKKDSAYTYYHCLALDSINDSWNDEGIIIHPEAHFTISCAYHITIAALNAIGIDENVEGVTPFLAEYCFCQTTLHNAMIAKSSPSDLAIAAKLALEQLPYQHPLSKRFLKQKKETR